MKKSLLFLSVLAVMVSCKKDETTDFTPTDVTGTSVLKGNVSKNVITPNGGGSWNSNARIPAAGVNVSVKVNKNSLYPNSTAMGADVYTGTTDANGNYSITVKSNATGVAAVVTIDGFTGTQDTIINGITKTGLFSTYAGTTNNRTLFMGQNSQLDYQFNASVVSTNPNTVLKIGSAIITGSVGVNFVKEVLTGTVISITSTMVPVASHKVYLNFSNDPNTQATRAYEAVTDANGYYSFTLTTVAPGTSGFSQNASIYVPDYAATRDTLKANNTIKTGRAGVYSGQTINQNSVYNNAIRNATHFSYIGFTQN
jgi:hypothetical protein